MKTDALSIGPRHEMSLPMPLSFPLAKVQRTSSKHHGVVHLLVRKGCDR